MKKLLLILPFIIFSCKSTKPKIVQNIVHDSVFVQNTIYKTNQILDTMVIENPCDSNGILKDFQFKYNSGGTTIESKAVGGKIIQKVYIPKVEYKDSVVVKIQQKTIVQEVKVKNPINTFLLYSTLLFGGLFIGRLILKRFIL